MALNGKTVWSAVGLLVAIGTILAGWVWVHQTNQAIHQPSMPRVEAEVRFNSIQNSLDEFKADQKRVNEKVLEKLERIEKEVR